METKQMTLTLTPKTAAKLEEMAEREGTDPGDLARSILADALWEFPDDYDDTVAAVEEAFEAIEQGRVRPFETFRREHESNYPANLK
jgi:predicted transcriptional regulator